MKTLMLTRKHCYLQQEIVNRSFLNFFWPLIQSKSWCSSFHMKIGFHSHEFSHEQMSNWTRFEKEAKGNLEMAYYYQK